MPASDADFLRAALAEAHRGLGQTSPNPAVGAVIVRGGRIIARGHHATAGKPHAEIAAIAALPSPAHAAGATLYITLEPCSTSGRTPPCTDAILTHRFARVVYGATDPNPAHRGRARRLLTRAGITVTSGILRAECTALNRPWNHWITTGRPYVIAKCGMSLDGRIASHPDARWITSPESRVHAMLTRARIDAILVGAETVRIDNPALTVRGIPGARQPWRVIWSKSGKLPPTARVFTDRHRDRTLILSGDLEAVLATLGTRQITSVLVEGGGHTLGELFDRQLANEIHFYTAPVLLGGPVPAVGGLGVPTSSTAQKLITSTYQKLGPDLLTTAYVPSASSRSLHLSTNNQ